MRSFEKEERMDLQKKRDNHAAYMRKWRAADPERWSKIAKKARKKWKANHRDQHREAQRVNRHRARLDTLRLLGGCHCAQCGFDDWRALQVDHVDGSGYADSRTKQNVHTFRKWVLNHLDEAKKFYQVLCANCNWIKRHENEEHGDNVY